MLSAYKYRLYPKREQEMRLKRSLSLLCSLYNELRAAKIEQYRTNGVSLTKTDLRALALEQRRKNPELQTVFSQVAQDVADRVYTAFKNYLEKRARFPKSKHPKKYLSLTYPQFGFKINPEKGLYLSGAGYLRIFIHRPLIGKVKRLTIKYQAGEWYAIFITERDAPREKDIEEIPLERVRGADMGLEKFLVLDDAASIEYPEFLRRSEEKVKTLQRRLPDKKKGSRRWRRLCFTLARTHLHIKRQREDWQNKLIYSIFKENDIIVLEKLNVSEMLGNHSLAKSISDSSWGKFVRKVIFKAQALGKHVVFIDPWGTTQFCHSCLQWVQKELEDREHNCPNCGVKIPRDLNSAKLIKRLGILTVRCPPSDGGLSPAEPGPLPSLRRWQARGVEAGSHPF